MRRLLLDTHALLWALSDPGSLSDEARDAISDRDSYVAASAASAWELSIKQTLGRVEIPEQLEEELERVGFDPLAITVPHALRAGSLPPHHRDPFDRMLVAQSEIEELTLVTRDERLALYGVPVLAA